MHVISNKDAHSQFVFDVIDTIMHMDVWIKFPVDVLITNKISHWCL